MKRWFCLAVFVVGLTTTATDTFTCSCSVVKVKTTKTARQNWFNRFDGAIFVGTVESVEPILIRADTGWQDEGRTAEKFVFKVERFWKGVEESKVTVYTLVGCCGCIPNYTVGRKYFVTSLKVENRLEIPQCTIEEPGAAKSFEKDFGKSKLPQSPTTPSHEVGADR
jgi:hypothetical protein